MRVPISRAHRRETEAAYGRLCWLCELPIEGPISVDHVHPVIYGGAHDVTNFRPAHSACNTMRGEWDVRSYYAWALSTGRAHLVPARLHDELVADAVERTRAAWAHYARATRAAALEPLGGSWAFISELA